MPPVRKQPSFGKGKLPGGTPKSPLAFKPGPVKLTAPSVPHVPPPQTPPDPHPNVHLKFTHPPTPGAPPLHLPPTPLAPKPPRIPESRGDEPNERRASSWGWFAGVASALQPNRELPEPGEFHQRSPFPLPAAPPHAPLAPLPSLSAPEGHTAQPLPYTGRADLPPLAPPQLGGTGFAPPMMDIEAY